jgi:hypothetical protein
MNIQIRKAERSKKKAKIALIGVAGGGKTYTALKLAKGLGERILLLDTERSSATLYADVVSFDHASLENFEYETFLAGIEAAEQGKYDVLIIDSLSHAWQEFLEQHETIASASRSGNSYTAWAKITPKYNKLIEKIIAYPGHTIVTMRAKMEYTQEQNEKGKTTPKKIGLGAVMRPGSEYEFDVVGIIDIDHNLIIEKTRFDWLADKIVKKADEKLGIQIKDWLEKGKDKEKKEVTNTTFSASIVVNTAKTATREAMQAKIAYRYDFNEIRALYASEIDRAKILPILSESGGVVEGNILYCCSAIPEMSPFLLSSPGGDAAERALGSDTLPWEKQADEVMDKMAAIARVEELKTKNNITKKEN